MKYFFGALLCFFTLSGCDDGDLITESFNFDAITTLQKCSTSNVIYKINGAEALILSTPEFNFINEETEVNSPRVKNIGTTDATSVTYKKLSSTATTNELCGTPTLVVLEEWKVVGGSIEIVTTKVVDTNGITIIAYNHKITFKNVTFVTNGKQISYTSYEYGNYRTDVVDLAFAFEPLPTQKCSNNSVLFKYSNSKVLLLDIDPSLFLNEVTAVGSPRTDLINTTTNRVIYRVYSGDLNSNFFCLAIPPALPTLVEEWIPEIGVAATSGIIKVETVALNATTFEHTISLYKTTFVKGNFKYSPNPDGDYIFGTYTTTL
ncbi:hypothetical protein [Flavobacterium sp.]|uniref:hypothetical protein n=1 Tax=Flavobacterium sp. TaxID=239 RepID=UPI00286E61AC|nr:hypothetical protein [Flavobacterium sp.]